MIITITWTDTEARPIDDDITEYYKIGTWSLDGAEQGPLETPTSETFQQLVSDETIISQLTDILSR